MNEIAQNSSALIQSKFLREWLSWVGERGQGLRERVMRGVWEKLLV
jgi:hypothetical protein